MTARLSWADTSLELPPTASTGGVAVSTWKPAGKSGAGARINSAWFEPRTQARRSLGHAEFGHSDARHLTRTWALQSTAASSLIGHQRSKSLSVVAIGRIGVNDPAS